MNQLAAENNSHQSCCPRCRFELEALLTVVQEMALGARPVAQVASDDLERAVEIQFKRVRKVTNPDGLRATIKKRLSDNPGEVLETLKQEAGRLAYLNPTKHESEGTKLYRGLREQVLKETKDEGTLL